MNTKMKKVSITMLILLILMLAIIVDVAIAQTVFVSNTTIERTVNSTATPTIPIGQMLNNMSSEPKTNNRIVPDTRMTGNMSNMTTTIVVKKRIDIDDHNDHRGYHPKPLYEATPMPTPNCPFVTPAYCPNGIADGPAFDDRGCVKPRVCATPVPIETVNITPLFGSSNATVYDAIFSYDSIRVNHVITLCNPVSDKEYAITGLTEKNCGNPDLVINDFPLDNLPSGGNSGIISASEMVYLKVSMNEGSGISLIPWRTETVTFDWYDSSDGRELFHGSTEANAFNVVGGCIIGHFSWEINKPSIYYVDITTEDGNARVVFNVTDNGQATITATPTPIGGGYQIPATVSPTYNENPVVTYTASPTPIVTYTASPTVTVTQNLETNDPDPGCWSSAYGFGMCAGDVAIRTGVGLIMGLGKGITKLLGLY
jgi:hypothetical protein